MELLLRSTNKGYTIIELLVALAIASLMLPALLTGLVSSREGKAQQTQRRQAVSLLNEAEEAVRSYRNRGWDSFAVNGTYHPVVIVTGKQFLSHEVFPSHDKRNNPDRQLRSQSCG